MPGGEAGPSASPASSACVAVYSSAYNDALVRQLPYVPFFVERGLSHVGLLRDPGNRLVIVTPDPIPEEVVDYHLRDVLGLNPEAERDARTRLLLLATGSSGPRSLAGAILDDPGLIGQIQRYVAGSSRALLVNVAPSEESERLGEALQLQVEEAPAAPAGRWGSKAGNKELLAAVGEPAIRWSERVLRSAGEVASAAIRLTRDSPDRRAMVKLDHPGWSAGMGNAVADAERLSGGAGLEESLSGLLVPWTEFELEIGRDGAIVEEFLPGVTSSPSGQGFIDTGGRVTLKAVHEQALEGAHFLGSTYPVPEEFRDRIADSMSRIGRGLAERGVRGTFGVDFVAAGGRLIVVEVNVRKLGTNHVMSYVEAATGDRLEPFGRLEGSGKPLAYVHRRLFRPERLTGLPASQAIESLRDADLLWDPVGGEGTILHILGGLPACGYVEMVTVGADLKRAAELDEAVQAELFRAAGAVRPPA